MFYFFCVDSCLSRQKTFIIKAWNISKSDEGNSIRNKPRNWTLLSFLVNAG